MESIDYTQPLPCPYIPPEYQINRGNEYPPLGEQMDMLWHAMDDGVLTKIEPFYSQIKAIKDKYPKEA